MKNEDHWVFKYIDSTKCSNIKRKNDIEELNTLEKNNIKEKRNEVEKVRY